MPARPIRNKRESVYNFKLLVRGYKKFMSDFFHEQIFRNLDQVNSLKGQGADQIFCRENFISGPLQLPFMPNKLYICEIHLTGSQSIFMRTILNCEKDCTHSADCYGVRY